MGIQGSGKSTFYAKKFGDTHVRINLDMLRTRNREKMIFENCLDTTQSCVVDNTNITQDERGKYIKEARKRGFSVTGYFLRSRVHECINRNSKREGKAKVPVSVITSRYNKLQTPSLTEGFDRLYYVSIINGEFVVEEYKEGEKQSSKSPVISRKISVPVSDRIDWMNIIRSLAWEKDLSIEFKETSDIKNSLKLLMLTGKISSIMEFSKEIHEKIEEAIGNVPVYEDATFVVEDFCFRNKGKTAILTAIDTSLDLIDFREIKFWFKKCSILQVRGTPKNIKEFAEKISLTAFCQSQSSPFLAQ